MAAKRIPLNWVEDENRGKREKKRTLTYRRMDFRIFRPSGLRSSDRFCRRFPCRWQCAGGCRSRSAAEPETVGSRARTSRTGPRRNRRGWPPATAG